MFAGFYNPRDGGNTRFVVIFADGDHAETWAISPAHALKLAGRGFPGRTPIEARKEN